MTDETLTRQDADGTPFVSYYDKATSLSFVWDGHSDVVQVCAGGAGEPVTDTFPVLMVGDPPLRAVLTEFAAGCRDYIAASDRR
jgi:hypothetical protein